MLCVCVLFCSHIAQLKVSVSCVVSNTRTPKPIDPFLVPSGGRTAAAVAALERSFGQQDEDMSSSLRRLSSTQDYSAMSPSPSFDTSSVGGSSSDWYTRRNTFCVSNSYCTLFQ